MAVCVAAMLATCWCTFSDMTAAKTTKATTGPAGAPGPKLGIVYTNTQIVNAATGRFGEVANDIKFAEPYVITTVDGVDDITISPLTRRRRKKMKAAQAAYLLTGAQLAEAQNQGTADQGTISRIESLLEQAERAYDEALFGDVSAAVVEYFEDLQEELWDAMYDDVHAALVNRIELPEDVCSKCGQAVEHAAGKGESSSTSSTNTGTN